MITYRKGEFLCQTVHPSRKPTKAFQRLRKLLQLFFGAVIGGIYRILRYVETRNIVTLVVGIVGLVTFVGNIVIWIVDLVTEAVSNRITVFAD